MKRVFIIHGWGDIPEHGWYPWLKTELENKGFEVNVPKISFKTSTPSEVLSRIADNIGKPDKNTFLVGHSTGCITILKYMEGLKADEKIGGAILVSAFVDNIGHKDIDRFFVKAVDWNKIRKHCDKFTVIQSDNDYYVPIEHAKVFNENLGAKLIIEHEKGHFSQNDGITELPVALEELLKMARK